MRFEILLVLAPAALVFGFIYLQLKKGWGRAERISYTSTLLTLGFVTAVSALSTLWAKSYVVYTAIFPLTLSFFCSCAALWRNYLIRREREEAEERKLVSEEYDREDLFDDRDDAMKMAEVARKQFDKWAIPAFTIALSSAIILVAWMLNRQFSSLLTEANAQVLADRLVARQSVETLGFSVFFVVSCTLLGVYWNGLSREPGLRYLRPVGQWLIFSGLVFGVAAILMGIELFTDTNDDFASTRVWDVHAARYLLIIVIAFGVQMLVNCIMEFYRPRVKGEEARPLYESRLLAVVTEPGGIARNVAQTLDYQFGFKVSESWFYSFVEKGLIPFILALALCVYLLDCFFLVDTHEVAILTRFGKRQGTYQPGIHLKWPWPVDRAVKHPVKTIRKIEVGFVAFEEGGKHSPGPEPGAEETMGDPTGRVVVWGKKHHKEETYFLTAARSEQDQESEEEKIPVINFLSCNVAVYYKIREQREGETRAPIVAYVYNHENPARLLRQIATREVITYLASADLLEVVSVKNKETQLTIGERIKARINDLGKDPETDLGIEVVHFAITGVHPPVEAAESFQNIITATQEKQQLIHEAESFRSTVVNEAIAETYKIKANAEAHRFRMKSIPQNEVKEFEAKLRNYRQAPEVFKMRSYLDVLEKISTSEDLPTYVIAAPNARKVTKIVFKEKRPGVEDLDTELPE